MRDWGAVQFHCSKCDRLMEQPAHKAGDLLSCVKCHHIQKIPGIARQGQATDAQLEVMRRAARIQLRAVVPALVTVPLLLCASFVYVAISVCLGGSMGPQVDKLLLLALWALVLMTFAAGVFLLFAETSAIQCLGASRTVSFLLFAFCWPVWLVRSVRSLVRLRAAIKKLTAAGPRVESADAAGAPQAPR